MFWDRFVKACNEKGITPSAAVSELGMSHSIVTKWKNGAIPQDTSLMKIAEYFGVSVDFFRGQSGVPQSVPPQTKDQTELLEELRRRPSMQVLFSLAKNASDEDIERAIKIIMALKQ